MRVKCCAVMNCSESPLEDDVLHAGFGIEAQIVPESEVLSLLGRTYGAKVHVMGTRPGCRFLEEGIDDIKRTKGNVELAEPAHVVVEQVPLFQRATDTWMSMTCLAARPGTDVEPT